MCTQQQGGSTGGSAQGQEETTPPVPLQTADQQKRPKQKIDHWTAELPTANID